MGRSIGRPGVDRHRGESQAGAVRGGGGSGPTAAVDGAQAGASRRHAGGRPRAIVLGDLVLDIVLTPSRPLRSGTDVVGRVVFRQGGSAATTARVLAGEGVASALVTAAGEDGAGPALAAYLREQGVEVHAVPVRSPHSGRLGVLIEPSSERTFVADRGAILRLRPHHLRAAWFHDADLLHLPAYSLLGERLTATAERAATLARARGARVSVDLASAGFLEDFGAEAVLATVRRIRPDVLLANELERRTVLAGRKGVGVDALLDLAPIVVLKQGREGALLVATGLGREIVAAARPASVADSTGAGDAFDAGFLAAWLRSGAPQAGPRARSALERALRAGHRAARREVLGRRMEFSLADLRPAR